MKLPRRRFLNLAAGVAALPAVSTVARAQTYPTRPITVIVGFAAGGPTDTGARILAEALRPRLGQAVVVENVTGANGSLGGVGRVVRAAPDGYTLSIGDLGTHVVNQVIYPLQYNLRTDLKPIALIRTGAYLIVAKNGMPGENLKELAAWLTAHPDKALAGTGGFGGAEHLAGLRFQDTTNTRIQFVPYRGSGPAIQDMLGGQIDMLFASPIVSLPLIRAGQIKAYAVMSSSRLQAAPEIPSVDEAGFPGAYYLSWSSLWAPKGTPSEVIARLNAAVLDALSDPTVRARFADLGTEVASNEQQTPDGLAVFHKAEIEKWWPLVRAANIKGE
jgi:tripartite-type tricarboxylate transporter receptor subunit TctC